jgi:hypothetical protein
MTTRSQLDGLLDTALTTYVELKAAEEEGAASDQLARLEYKHAIACRDLFKPFGELEARVADLQAEVNELKGARGGETMTTWLEKLREEYVRSEGEENPPSMHVKFTEAETAWKYVIPAAPKPRIRDHLGHYLHIELRTGDGVAVVVCGKCGVVLAEEAL